MKRTGVGKPTARSCYGHLGGKLGNRLFERLIELGWFEPEEFFTQPKTERARRFLNIFNFE